MEFFRQEDWSGLPFPSPGDLPDPGIEPGSPSLQADSLPSEPQGMETYLKDILKVVISQKQYNMNYYKIQGHRRWHGGKEPSCQYRRPRKGRFDS